MLGGRQRSIRHLVQKTDMQFTNILVQCSVYGQDLVTAVTQSLKRWQIIVCYERHSVEEGFLRG